MVIGACLPSFSVDVAEFQVLYSTVLETQTPQPPPLTQLRAVLGMGPSKPPPLPSKEELEAFQANWSEHPRASSVAAAHDAYETIDKDHDGTLSYDEVKSEVLRRCPSVSDKYLDELLRTFDTDASGESELPMLSRGCFGGAAAS